MYTGTEREGARKTETDTQREARERDTKICAILICTRTRKYSNARTKRRVTHKLHHKDTHNNNGADLVFAANIYLSPVNRNEIPSLEDFDGAALSC